MAEGPEVWPGPNRVQSRLREPDPVTLKIETLLHPKPPTPGPAIEARPVVDNADNGTYSVSFPSVNPGPCVLSIEVNGRAIKGSGPFDITVHRDIRCIKGPNGYLKFSRQPGELYGVAVSSNGKIFVGDHSHHAIHVFNKERKYVKSFGTEGNQKGQLYNPRGLAVDDGLVYVATCSRIEVFTEDGTSVRQILIGAGEKPPWNVTVHKQQLYIADYFNRKVSVYTLQGDLLPVPIGSDGNGLGCPTGVAFAPNGDMYVTGTGEYPTVQVFDANGRYKRQFGQVN